MDQNDIRADVIEAKHVKIETQEAFTAGQTACA